MDFRFAPKEEAFRQQVRRFMEEEVPPRWRELDPVAWEESEESWHLKREFERKLGQRRWLAPQYPQEYGGMDASQWQAVILREEMAYNRAPIGFDTEISVNWVGPTLLSYGTEEQRAQYLPDIASGEVVFCLGYSESGAGSDLAAVQTRAEEDGDSWVVTGVKTFTSLAHWANFCWLVARTEGAPRSHQGLSLFVVDMKSQGITVAPLINILGAHSFNQVYFDRARVPRENLVGEKNRGWYQLMTALSFERSGVIWPGQNRRLLDELTEVVRRAAGQVPEAVRLLARRKVAGLVVENEVLRLLSYRVAWLQSLGRVADAEVSIAFVLGCELVRRVADAAVHILGLFGQLGRDSAWAAWGGRVPQGYLTSLAAGIGGGTLEIQRNIIATRGLGLPRS